MPKLISALFLALLAFVQLARADADSQAIAGYGKTTWGMTPEEVIAAESPRAKASPKPSKYKNGAGLVMIPSLKIRSVGFGAVFVFDANRKLNHVILEGEEQKNHLINIDYFASLEQLLIEKYGPPTYKTDLRPQAEGIHTISWKLPKTTVRLDHLYIPSIVTKLTVSYAPTALPAQDSKDL